MTDAEPIDLQDKAYWQARAEKAEAELVAFKKGFVEATYAKQQSDNAEIARLRDALQEIKEEAKKGEQYAVAGKEGEVYGSLLAIGSIISQQWRWGWLTW